MSNKYKEAMDKITVTEELKEKIIKSAAERELIKSTSEKKLIYPYFAKMGLVFTACFLLVISVLTSKYKLTPEVPVEGDSHVYSIQGIEFFKSTAEMEKYLGYSFKMPEYLPEGYAMNSCRVIAESLVEISYTDGDNSIIYRTEKTIDNISGDYNSYSNTEVEVLGDSSVTLNSTEGIYYNGVWNNDDFSYSLSVQKGLDRETFLRIIESVE